MTGQHSPNCLVAGGGDRDGPRPAWTAPKGSWASDEATRRKMVGNRSRDTKPELLVRSLVHGRGLRYRVAQRPLPGLRRTADLVFRPTRVAVFVDGCYWHGCPTNNAQVRRCFLKAPSGLLLRWGPEWGPERC